MTPASAGLAVAASADAIGFNAASDGPRAGGGAGGALGAATASTTGALGLGAGGTEATTGAGGGAAEANAGGGGGGAGIADFGTTAVTALCTSVAAATGAWAAAVTAMPAGLSA